MNTEPELDLRPFVRPSEMSRLANCPGSAQQQARALLARGPKRTNDYAQKGTAGHKALQECVAWFVEEWNTSRGGWLNFPKTWADLPEECWSIIRLRAPEKDDRGVIVSSLLLILDLIARYKVGRDDVLLEHWMDGRRIGLPNGGTADVVLIAVRFKHVIVVDYKLGRVDVELAEANDQCGSYACMAADSFECEQVDTFIIQPMAMTKIHSARFDAELLKDRAQFTQDTINDAMQPDAPLNADLPTCNYCGALYACDAVKKKIREAMEKFTTFGPTTTAEWGEALKFAKLAQKFTEAVVEEVNAKHEADANFIPDGFIRTKASHFEQVENIGVLMTKVSEEAPDLEMLVMDTMRPITVKKLKEIGVPEAVWHPLQTTVDRAGYFKLLSLKAAKSAKIPGPVAGIAEDE